MDVIDIAVAVVIDSFHTVLLSLVHPHVGSKVRMVILNTLVADGHDDGRVSGGELPCVTDIDVRSDSDCRSDTEVAVVHIVPLVD